MKLLKTSFGQAGILGVGTVVNSILGLVFYVLIARGLGLENFGYFSFLLGLGILAAELGDLGIGSALVKFGSGNDFSGVFVLSLMQRAVVSAIITLLFVVSGHIYSATTAISLLFLSVTTQGLLARQRYWQYVTTNICGNTVRLLLTSWLVFMGLLTTVSGLVAFGLANLVAFLVGWAFLKPGINLAGVGQVIPAVFRYSRYLAVSYGITSLAAKVDIPLLYVLGGAGVTGLYSSAQKLISVFAQVAAAVEGVFAPKLSRQERRSFRDYILVALLAGIGTLSAGIVSGLVIPLMFGAKYTETVPIFNWLLVGMVFFLFSGPFTAVVLYQKGKSGYHLAGSALQLVLTVGLFTALVPSLGVWGAVATFIVSQFFNLCFFIFVWQYVRHRP